MPYTSKNGTTVPDFSVMPHRWVHGELSGCKLCTPCVTGCAPLAPCAVCPLAFARQLNLCILRIVLNGQWPASHFLSSCSCAGRVHGVRKVQERTLHGTLRSRPEAVQGVVRDALRAPRALRGMPPLLYTLIELVHTANRAE
jgi:hypothetical protein